MARKPKTREEQIAAWIKKHGVTKCPPGVAKGIRPPEVMPYDTLIPVGATEGTFMKKKLHGDDE